MSEVQNLERLIVQWIKSFKNDPPATRYELGYLNALKELLEDAGIPAPRHPVGRRAPKKPETVPVFEQARRIGKRPTTTPKRKGGGAP